MPSWRELDLDIPHIAARAAEDLRIRWSGDHGIAHWGRVLENGLRLAARTGADARVVALFALFHDSGRRNEFTDPGHGARGARKAAELCGVVFDLDRPSRRLLHRACAIHTGATHDDDVTVRTCLDADRLDLLRVGIEPDPRLLLTDAARDPRMLAFANDRALRGVVPECVRGLWDELERRERGGGSIGSIRT